MASTNKKQKELSYESPQIANERTKTIGAKQQYDIEDPSYPNDATKQNAEYTYIAKSYSHKPLREIKSKLKRQIFFGRTIDNTIKSMSSTSITDAVVGFGIGVKDFSGVDVTDIHDNSLLNLEIYTVIPVSEESFRRCMYDIMQIDDAGDDNFPLKLRHCGPIDACDLRCQVRPSPCGISIAHSQSDDVGTLGCLVRGIDDARSRRILLLSNNHVIGLCNKAHEGDEIIAGDDANNIVALFDRFKHIDFSGQENLVDAATAWCWKDKVRPEIAYYSSQGLEYLNTANESVEPELGMRVSKCGRTTNKTSGRIVAMEVDICVSYGWRRAYFKDQLVVDGTSGTFSDSGDSGSLIFTDDEARNPVGLLFAGAQNCTFANKISHVLDSLDIRLYSPAHQLVDH